MLTILGYMKTRSDALDTLPMLKYSVQDLKTTMIFSFDNLMLHLLSYWKLDIIVKKKVTKHYWATLDEYFH